MYKWACEDVFNAYVSIGYFMRVGDEFLTRLERGLGERGEHGHVLILALLKYSSAHNVVVNRPLNSLASTLRYTGHDNGKH